MHADDLYFLQTMTDLQIDDFCVSGFVEYKGLFHEQGDVELIYGKHAVSEMISTRPFKKLYPFAMYFVLNMLPKLAALRKRHLLIKYLHWAEIQRLVLLNSAMRGFFGVGTVGVVSLAEHLLR